MRTCVDYQTSGIIEADSRYWWDRALTVFLVLPFQCMVAKYHGYESECGKSPMEATPGRDLSFDCCSPFPTGCLPARSKCCPYLPVAAPPVGTACFSRWRHTPVATAGNGVKDDIGYTSIRFADCRQIVNRQFSNEIGRKRKNVGAKWSEYLCYHRITSFFMPF